MFEEIFNNYSWQEIEERIYSASESDAARSVQNTSMSESDIINLLSPAADPLLEEMACRSSEITRRRFGKTLQMYTPLYISNHCTNSCLYCGFNTNNTIKRTTLTDQQIDEEAGHIYNMGFRHIIILTGEDRNAVSPEKMADVTKRLHRKFSSLTLEVYPMSVEEYEALCSAGADGLTVYQETYHKETYSLIHPRGRKRDFSWRLNTPDRGGLGGMRKIGIGALLGLTDWRVESFFTALHAVYLTKKYWKSQIQISFPRLRNAAGGFQPMHTVSDRDLTHLICAFRLILNDAGIAISTREPAELRDNLLPLGITMISAGSKTGPGGHTCPDSGGDEQFQIMDSRSPSQMAAIIADAGLEAVWKDWDRDFTE